MIVCFIVRFLNYRHLSTSKSILYLSTRCPSPRKVRRSTILLFLDKMNTRALFPYHPKTDFDDDKTLHSPPRLHSQSPLLSPLLLLSLASGFYPIFENAEVVWIFAVNYYLYISKYAKSNSHQRRSAMAKRIQVIPVG